jgi:hypothetical protein
MSHISTRDVTAQEALARLVVNPAASLRILETRCPSSVGLDIWGKERSNLVSFLNTHGRAFRTSVLLLRKRRLDNVLETLSVTAKLFSDYELSCYWDDYLASIAIDFPSPKNPLLESIRFCCFLLNSLPPVAPQAALVAYDLARNKVIVDAAADETSYRHDSHIEDHARWAPLLHPSARAEAFSTNVGAMVKLVAQGADRNRVFEVSNGQPETILFFKNWARGGVGSLRINTATRNSLALFDGRRTAKELIDMSPALFNLLTAMSAVSAIAQVVIREKQDES